MIVWVTGASSGLGLHTAQCLRQNGWTVIAGARSFEEDPSDRTMIRLPLDVTSDASAQAFCDAALRLASPPDAIIHCAAVLVLGSCEETSIDEYRQVLETDFLGMVRMNRLVLPLFRKQGKGKIVMFSSINGLMAVPFQSAYTAAKHAVEGYAEALAMETAPFGVQVCLIEPGDHRSGSQRCRLHAKAMSDSSPYAQAYRQATDVIAHDEANGSDPDRLGQAVCRLLKRKRLPFRKCIATPDQRLAVLLHAMLPGRAMLKILESYYGRFKS